MYIVETNPATPPMMIIIHNPIFMLLHTPFPLSPLFLPGFSFYRPARIYSLRLHRPVRLSSSLQRLFFLPYFFCHALMHGPPFRSKLHLSFFARKIDAFFQAFPQAIIWQLCFFPVLVVNILKSSVPVLIVTGRIKKNRLFPNIKSKKKY